MRKLLIGVIVLLLIALGIVSLTQGAKIANVEVSSISQMSEKSKDVDKKIEEINTLKDTQYPQRFNELKKAAQNMENAKEEYLTYTSISTNDEVLEAMKGRIYKIEFLWTKLGQHVRNEEVVLDFRIGSSSIGATKSNDLQFTVNGTYAAITNFIYAIENDPDLSFKIENFKLVPGASVENLTATFTVRNVIIEGNTSSLTENVTNTSSDNSGSADSSANNSSNSSATANTNTNTTNANTTNANTTSTTNTVSNSNASANGNSRGTTNTVSQ